MQQQGEERLRNQSHTPTAGVATDKDKPKANETEWITKTN
jgi:hypothetical protein